MRLIRFLFYLIISFALYFGFRQAGVEERFCRLAACGLLALLVIIDFFVKESVKRHLFKSTMKNIDKMEGVEFEQYLKARFEDWGYKVTITKATADMGADLILERGDEKIAVQAKRYSHKVGTACVQQAVAGREAYEATGAICITNSYFTRQAKEIAERCNVAMWDRDVLREKFEL